jgi:hypothetical protein
MRSGQFVAVGRHGLYRDLSCDVQSRWRAVGGCPEIEMVMLLMSQT